MGGFCQKCGASIVGDERFCGSCGAAVRNPSNTDPGPGIDSRPAAATNYRNTDIQYDPSIIRQFANALYRQAQWIVLVHTVIGAFIGFILLGIFGLAIRVANFGNQSGSGENVVVIVVIVCGAIGYSIGMGKAYWLKLQAQVALCQVEIEYNTRALREKA